MNIQKATSLLFSLFICLLFVAQQHNIDSLKQVILLDNNDTSVVNALALIGDDFYYSSQNDSAIHYWEIAKEKSDFLLSKKELPTEIEHTIRTRNSVIYNDLAYLYTNKGLFDKALSYFKKSIAQKQKLNDVAGEIQGYSNIGYLYIQKDKTDSALFFNILAHDIAEKNNLTEQVGISSLQVAVLYTKIGLTEQALDYLFDAKKIFEQSQNNNALSVVLNNIAKAYLNLEEYNTALEYFFNSLELKYIEGDLASAANTYNNIGATYMRINEMYLAKKYNRLALEIFEKTDNIRGKATTLNNIGYIHQKAKEEDSALLALNQSLVLRRQINDKSGTAATLLNLAQLAYDNEHYKQANQLLDEAYNLAKDANDYTTLKDITLLLYKNNKEINKISDALKFHEQYLHYRELIQNKENLKSALRRNIEKNLTVSLPKKETPPNCKEVLSENYFVISKTKGYIIALVFGLLLTFLLIVTLRRR